MNKKKIISIFVLILGIIMIVLGVSITGPKEKDKIKNPSPSSDNVEKPNGGKEQPDEGNSEMSDEYRDAYNVAISLYEYGGRTVEMEEQDDRFIIYVKNSDGRIINTFYMDKDTGIISEEQVLLSEDSVEQD